jgi:hypothetical protein
MRQTPSLKIMALTAALLCGGCNPYSLGVAASPLFVKTQHVNLLNASYAAADVLATQTKQKFDKNRTLSILPFTEIVDENRKPVVLRNPKLGAVMMDQLQARFVQLGYRIVDGTGTAPSGILTGVYEVIGNDLAVRLRLKDAKTGELYGMYDYWMPVTSDIRRYMDERGGGIPLYKMREGLDQIIIP